MTADNRFSHVSDDPFDENDPFERAENANVAQVGVRPAGSPSSVEAAAQRRVRMTGRGEHEAEPSFEEALAHAFGDMGPSEEAERRMLAALTTAETKRHCNESTAREATKGSRRESNAITRPAAAQKTTPRRRPQIWKLAVPIAACLALLAGVGAWALGGINGSVGNMAASSDAMQNPGNALSSESAQPPAVGADAENARDQGGSAGSGTDSSESTNGSSGGSSGDASQGNLYIELSTGQRLRYALDDTGAARRANPALVGEAVESTFIYDGVGDTSSRTPCTVYAYVDSNYPYVVRAEGNDFYYLAVEAAS